MWNSAQDADDEEQQDYLLEGTEGLCSLSPLQVHPSNHLYGVLFQISNLFNFFLMGFAFLHRLSRGFMDLPPVH